MTSIFYYKRNCDKCSQVLQQIYKMGDLGKHMHFQCVDRRIVENGHTYIILENNARVIMPPQLTAVPAIVDLVKGGSIIYGDAIYTYLNILWEQHKMTAPPSGGTNGEAQGAGESVPDTLDGWDRGGSGIVSARFSSLDDPADTNQLFHYSSWNEPAPPQHAPASQHAFPPQTTTPASQHAFPPQTTTPASQHAFPPPQNVGRGEDRQKINSCTQSEIEQYTAQREMGIPQPLRRV